MKVSNDELKDLENIFNDGSILIKDMRDEIEYYYRRESAASRRAEAARWGVHYESSTGELIEELEEVS